MTNQNANNTHLHYSNLFKKTLEHLEENLSPFIWQVFFKNLSFKSFQKNTLEIIVSSTFKKNWILKFGLFPLYHSCLFIFQQAINIKLVERSYEILKIQGVSPSLKLSSSNKFSPYFPFKLNSLYKLDSFITDASTEILLHIGNIIAENPGTKYNPLFIAGPTGTGKTHLVQAIGSLAQTKNPLLKVVYISAEEWSNLFISAIQHKKFDEFRRENRTNCDILIMDDIHFLVGKEACQTEFIHTFNNLFQNCKQIIITSTKYPYEIKGLNPFLQSRLSCGLILDTKPPSQQINSTFLKRKINALGTNFSNEVQQFLSNCDYSSLRELEGVILRLSAFAHNNNCKLSIREAKICLSRFLKIKSSNQWELERICKHVASYFDITPNTLKSHCRQRTLVLARQMAMSLCKRNVPCTLVEIGKTFGGRDHSTVISSLKKIKNLEESNIKIKALLTRLQNTLD
ncbi:MAG: chromosomal replication initiator protein DnaA [Deltaproteobacteria bacterium]|nr:MAG: chromosomal replication initiator protein DnaA [Deltaproteobacteria bacterium]